jgi:hypothetical protein
MLSLGFLVKLEQVAIWGFLNYFLWLFHISLLIFWWFVWGVVIALPGENASRPEYACISYIPVTDC